jgi:hypothetical protein
VEAVEEEEATRTTKMMKDSIPTQILVKRNSLSIKLLLPSTNAPRDQTSVNPTRKA